MSSTVCALSADSGRYADALVSYRNKHTHPFNGPFSGTTWVSRYQKGKTKLDFTEARDSECQWHQLGRMQVCTSLQTDNHASTPPLSFLKAGCPFCRPTNSVKTLKALVSYSKAVKYGYTRCYGGGVLAVAYCRWSCYWPCLTLSSASSPHSPASASSPTPTTSSSSPCESNNQSIIQCIKSKRTERPLTAQ